MGTEDYIKKLFDSKHVVHVIGQLEKGELNTPHIQAYLGFS